MPLTKSNQAPSQPTDPEQELISSIIGHFRRGDHQALVAELGCHWPNERLSSMLASDYDDIVKVAATCLGLVGTSAECAPIAAALHHDDSVVVAMAEHALWQIWFRQGPPHACARLCRAVRLIELDRMHQAVHLLDDVLRRAPWFAEAYHQRAIAHCLCGSYVPAISDCKRALRLNPVHFAAQAEIGHCLVQLERYPEAIEAYHRTLQIHPRLDGIRQSIRQARALAASPFGTIAD